MINTSKFLLLAAGFSLSTLASAATTITGAGVVHESGLTHQLDDLSGEFSSSITGLSNASASAQADSANGSLQLKLFADSQQQGDGYSLYAYSALQETFSFVGVGPSPLDIAWSFKLQGSAYGARGDAEGVSNLSYNAGVSLFDAYSDLLNSSQTGNDYSLWDSGSETYDAPITQVLSGVLQVSEGAQYTIKLTLSALGNTSGQAELELSPSLLGLFRFELPAGVSLNSQGGVFLTQVGSGAEVPLPGAWLLMSSAIGLLAAARRRQ